MTLNLSPNFFAPLPDMVLDTILQFASDGPLKVAFDAKKKKFVDKINQNFTLLQKANQFKIDNPPHLDVDDPNFDYEIGTTELDIIENLTFKYPLKFRIHKGCRDGFYSNNGYLELTFSYSKSFNGYRTNKCTISLPEYYLRLFGRASHHYKNQLERNISQKHKLRVKNLVKGFNTLSYAPDVEFV
jgi:hypothetical protein